MRLRLRLLWLILASLWRKPLEILDESILSLRVLPNDIDISKITNDRYLALTDLGRIDLAVRNGLLQTMFKRRWAPLAYVVMIRFRHPLVVFQKYQLRTQIIYWDDDSLYLRQRFARSGRIVATGYVYATLLGPDSRVSPQDIFAVARQHPVRPEMPEVVRRLQELNAMIHLEQGEIVG